VTTPQDHWTRVRSAFAEVEEAPEPERAARLAALPEDIRVQVADLLRAAAASGSFLSPSGEPTIEAGDRLGVYHLVAEIGRGGMGAVFRAERRDGEYRKEVAIKLAAGRLFGPEGERRLIQERQILAQLDHPNIVRLLDGGIAGHQRYFVMELAEGEPITTYCRTRKMPLAERLRLFRQVSSAIHYAHQRLILHRDLKPTNIVVTGSGEVKVLDFGIAQMQDQDAGDASDTMMRPFSLACASPEQLRGERPSLASDIYSLGVLLYELATDISPQRRGEASFDEVYRRVVQEPVTAPGRVVRGLARDLDAIVLKAMASAPADRYGSVAELDADIDRFLSARPVLAVPPRAGYVFARFVQRNRALTITATALVALLAAGAFVYVRQARIERRRLADATQLVHAVIFEIQPKLEGMANALPIRQTLIQETMRYLESASRDAGRDVSLLHELSNAYRELARLQGDLTTSSLGALAPAAERFRRADVLMQRALALRPDDPPLLKDAAVLYSRIAAFENTQSRGDDALHHARMAMGYAERNVKGRPPGDFDARELLALTTFSLALTLPATAWQERVDAFARAGELYTRLAAEAPAKDALHRNQATTLRFVASLHSDRLHHAEAVAFGRRSLEVVERLLARQPSNVPLQLDVATSAGVLASWVGKTGDIPEAARLYARAIALNERIIESDRANARAMLLLADATRGAAANRLAAGDIATARVHVGRSLDLFASLKARGQFPASSGFRFADAQTILGNIERADGHESKACRAYRTARDLYEEMNRQSPLVDSVKADAAAARLAAERCGPAAGRTPS
jgi:eukaryotic-like serine/threonine-protein kinase